MLYWAKKGVEKMLIFKGLFNPIAPTERMLSDSFLKYVQINEENISTAGLVERIRSDYYSSHTNVSTFDLDRIWVIIKDKLTANAGLAQFTIDYGGAESDFFFPWLIAVERSPSEALEMSYGSGKDLTGKWWDMVPEQDNIMFFVHNDPPLIYNRERQLFVASIVTMCRATALSSKIVDFGAGRLAWARKHGFVFEPERQSIFAFDVDRSIVPEALFEKNTASIGLHYENNNFIAKLNDPKLLNSDLILLGGVASYYPIEMFRDTVLTSVHKLLKTGGVFFFDMQLDCPYYKRNRSIFNWPEMNLVSPLQAINTLESMRKLLMSKGIPFSAEYAFDSFNEYPTSVMVTMTKL